MRDDIERNEVPVVAANSQECLQRVGWLRDLPALIREMGADSAALMRASGLRPDALDDVEGRVSYLALGRLLAHTAAATQCPHIGLLAGRLCHVRDLGNVGEMLLNSPSVGDALRTLTVHQQLNGGGGAVFLLERDGTVDFGYAIYQPGMRGTRQVYDCTLAACFNVVRELCGPGWFPSEAFIPHAKPVEAMHYRNLLKVHPRFDAECCAVRFPPKWMEHRIEGADPQRHRHALAEAERADQGTMLHHVYRAVRVLLLNGKNSGDDVANALFMHRRTLNRRLKALGTTFQDVLDDVRLEVGRQLLADSRISLDDIAASLGYNGVSPFMRAFRRWTGTTPGHWRRANSDREGFGDLHQASLGTRHITPAVGAFAFRTPRVHNASRGSDATETARRAQLLA